MELLTSLHGCWLTAVCDGSKRGSKSNIFILWITWVRIKHSLSREGQCRWRQEAIGWVWTYNYSIDFEEQAKGNVLRLEKHILMEDNFGTFFEFLIWIWSWTLKSLSGLSGNFKLQDGLKACVFFFFSMNTNIKMA